MLSYGETRFFGNQLQLNYRFLPTQSVLVFEAASILYYLLAAFIGVLLQNKQNNFVNRQRSGRRGLSEVQCRRPEMLLRRTIAVFYTFSNLE